MKRTLKQFAYGFLYLAIFGLVFGGLYLKSKPAPTCFDKKQNQGEAGIDCGGPCAQSCSLGAIQPIETIGGVHLLFPDRTHVSFLSALKNPNTDLAAERFNYTLTAYGFDEKAVATIPGVSFIYGGEINKYLLVPNVPLPAGGVSRADLTITDPLWIQASGYERPNVAVQNYTTSTEGSDIVVMGEITNQDVITLPSITVTALFLGQFEEIVGASETELNNVGKDETRAFEIHHPSLSGRHFTTKIFISPSRP